MLRVTSFYKIHKLFSIYLSNYIKYILRCKYFNIFSFDFNLNLKFKYKYNLVIHLYTIQIKSN